MASRRWRRLASRPVVSLLWLVVFNLPPGPSLQPHWHERGCDGAVHRVRGGPAAGVSRIRQGRAVGCQTPRTIQFVVLAPRSTAGFATAMCLKSPTSPMAVCDVHAARYGKVGRGIGRTVRVHMPPLFDKQDHFAVVVLIVSINHHFHPACWW